MRKIVAILAILVSGALSAGVVEAGGKTATVTVQNQSEWEIQQFFLSPANEDEWGPDQLRDEVISKGESFKLSGIPCDTYDVKLVDEDEDECVVEAVDICAKGATWTISSKDLLKCQAGTN